MEKYGSDVIRMNMVSVRLGVVRMKRLTELDLQSWWNVVGMLVKVLCDTKRMVKLNRVTKWENGSDWRFFWEVEVDGIRVDWKLDEDVACGDEVIVKNFN